MSVLSCERVERHGDKVRAEAQQQALVDGRYLPTVMEEAGLGQHELMAACTHAMATCSAVPTAPLPTCNPTPQTLLLYPSPPTPRIPCLYTW